METRFADTALHVEPVERHGDRPKLTGYAAVFDSLSKPLRSPSGRMFRERIEQGAFLRSIVTSGRNIFALVEHDRSRKIASVAAGTLRLHEDAHGLYVEITPPDTTHGRDIVEEVRLQLAGGMSFGFNVAPGGDRFDRVGNDTIRTLTEIDLHEVTITGFPAYRATSIGLAGDTFGRSADRDRRERMLRLAEAA